KRVGDAIGFVRDALARVTADLVDAYPDARFYLGHVFALSGRDFVLRYEQLLELKVQLLVVLECAVDEGRQLRVVEEVPPGLLCGVAFFSRRIFRPWRVTVTRGHHLSRLPRLTLRDRRHT